MVACEPIATPSLLDVHALGKHTVGKAIEDMLMLMMKIMVKMVMPEQEDACQKVVGFNPVAVK